MCADHWTKYLWNAYRHKIDVSLPDRRTGGGGNLESKERQKVVKRA